MKSIELLSNTDLATILTDIFLCEPLVTGVLKHAPFSTLAQLISTTEQVWFSLEPEIKIAAFMRHPKIGDIETVKRTRHSQTEQQGIYAASEQVLAEFVMLNRHYQDKFGYIYLLFAPGKSAKTMLAILRSRLDNSPAQELAIASEQKHQINRHRLQQHFVSAGTGEVA